MDILYYMGKNGKREYTIAELALGVDLPPSTVHRILKTFADGGYVLLDKGTHLYRLGPALIQLGRAAGDVSSLKTAAMPYLQKIAEETGDDAFLMVISGYQSHTLAKAEGPNRIKIVESFEANFDLHCGANRKMLLAFQPDSFIREYMAMGLKSYTASTITDPETLWLEIKTIREERVSFSLSEFIDGAMGISAPVFDHSGKLAASIGTSGPAFQVTSSKINARKKIISECAMELSKKLGFPDSKKEIVPPEN